MRMLDQFIDPRAAQRLAWMLQGDGIDCQLNESDAGTALWVLDETRMDEAKQILATFRDEPKSAPLAKLEAAGKAKSKAAAKPRRAAAPVVSAREAFDEKSTFGQVTMFLVSASVAVAFISELGEKHSVAHLLTFVDYRIAGGSIYWNPNPLSSIMAGQPWRVITPIFLHFDILHIAFNLWMTVSLGGRIEGKHGSWYLLFLTIIVAVLSNAVQAMLGGTPRFGGMSGVVYAFFGFLWIRAHVDKRYSIRLRPDRIVMLLAWFAFGFTGILSIANGAHAGGLVLGMAWGALTGWRANRQRSTS